MPDTYGDISEPIDCKAVAAGAPSCEELAAIFPSPPEGFEAIDPPLLPAWIPYWEADVVGLAAKLLVDPLAPICVNFCSNMRSFYII